MLGRFATSRRTVPPGRARAGGTLPPMTTERVTVTLPAELVAEARDAVERGVASSLSAYIAEAIAARQVRDRSLATLADLYGGPPPPDELAVARQTLRLVPPAAAV
jgi:antitoxin ParD1/3/4